MSTIQKIRYSDCDPQGIVFNGNYARYWDDAATDWLEDAGFGGSELGGIGVDVVTARLEMDFRAAATLGDEIETTCHVDGFGKTSMVIDIISRRVADGELLVEGKLVYVFVDPEGFRPVAVPEALRTTLP